MKKQVISFIARLFFSLTLLLSPLSAETSPPPTLSFQSNLPIVHHIITLVELNQEIPDLSFKAGLEQTLDMETSILPKELVEEVKAPLVIQCTIKRIRLRAKGNHENVLFDSQADQTSAHMAQLQHIIDFPIRIHLDENYRVEGPIEDLLSINRDLPSLAFFFSERFFSELLSSFFALAEKELTAGQHIPTHLGFGEFSPTVIPAHYEVTAANFKEVETNIKGRVDELTLIIDPAQLPDFSFVTLSDKQAEEMKYTISGYITGKARWEKRHAMIHSARFQHTYNAHFQMGGLEWPMTLNITHQIESKRAAP